MIRLSALLAILFILCNCATVEVPDFYAHVTLPASGDGFGVKTVSKTERTIPATQWEKIRRRGVVILPEDWAILKKTVRKNCITNKCKQAVGALDGLFMAIDHALKQIEP